MFFELLSYDVPPLHSVLVFALSLSPGLKYTEIQLESVQVNPYLIAENKRDLSLFVLSLIVTIVTICLATAIYTVMIIFMYLIYHPYTAY